MSKILVATVQSFSVKYTVSLQLRISIFIFRAMKIKCDQPEFIQVSRIKPSQWKNLISEFQAIANNLKNQKKRIISEEVEKLSQKTGKYMFVICICHPIKKIYTNVHFHFNFSIYF